jgi:hypothetical protein
MSPQKWYALWTQPTIREWIEAGELAALADGVEVEEVEQIEVHANGDGTLMQPTPLDEVA